MSNVIKKPLTRTIEMMNPKDLDKVDIGEYSGLRVMLKDLYKNLWD